MGTYEVYKFKCWCSYGTNSCICALVHGLTHRKHRWMKTPFDDNTTNCSTLKSKEE